jgi:hypothetical protein
VLWYTGKEGGTVSGMKERRKEGKERGREGDIFLGY